MSSYALQALRAQALQELFRTNTLQWAVAPSAPVAATAALHHGDGIAVILVTVAKTNPNRLAAI